jgi:glycerol-3-phosphate acyltransferase PlsY
MLLPLLAIALAYLLGSVNGSLVVGRLKGGVDIRKLGSGNAGGTNALRTMGPWFALAVVIVDVAKGWLAAAWLPGALAALLPAGAVPDAALPAACGFAAVVGHVFPVFHGFRGGKGGATLIGALAGLAPATLPWLFLAWFALVAAFGFVGLATTLAAAALVPVVLALGLEPRQALLVFAVAAAALVAYSHRANFARMSAGTEPRARRLWLLGRLFGRSTGG